jgi:hypothetical protein
MSRTTSFSNKPIASNKIILGSDINPNLRVEYDNICNEIQNKLFFDQDLTYDHLMFILNHQNTIEHRLVQVINHRIHDLDIPHGLHQRLIENLNKFSLNFIQINTYTNTHQPYVFVNDDESDEESYFDDDDDDIDSYEDDMYDDLENLILDQIEMEHDINVFNNHTQANNDNNNNNHHHYSAK